MHKKRKQIVVVKQKGSDTAIDFDYKKLSNAFYDAHKLAEEKKQKEYNEQREKAIAEWQKNLGYIEYDKNEKKCKKLCHNIRNGVVVFFKMMTLKREYAKTDVTTLSLLRMSLNSVLALIKWSLYLLSVILVVSSFYSFNKNIFIPFEIAFVMYGFIAFVIGRLVRVAQFEVEHISEREYLLGLLSAVTSFVAVIIALIALFVEK